MRRGCGILLGLLLLQTGCVTFVQGLLPQGPPAGSESARLFTPGFFQTTRVPFLVIASPEDAFVDYAANAGMRAPNTPLPFREEDGRIVEEPGQLAQLEEARQAFRRVLVRQLERTPRKEVFLFVHGYHNSFADAAFAMAELWHFLGRIGVPIVYTWPAGHPGLFGYTYDRESSEFTSSTCGRFWT